MDDELNAFALSDADLQHAAILVGSDEHHEITRVEHPNRMAVRMQRVLVPIPCLRAPSGITRSIVTSYLDSTGLSRASYLGDRPPNQGRCTLLHYELGIVVSKLQFQTTKSQVVVPGGFCEYRHDSRHVPIE